MVSSGQVVFCCTNVPTRVWFAFISSESPSQSGQSLSRRELQFICKSSSGGGCELSGWWWSFSSALQVLLVHQLTRSKSSSPTSPWTKSRRRALCLLPSSLHLRLSSLVARGLPPPPLRALAPTLPPNPSSSPRNHAIPLTTLFERTKGPCRQRPAPSLSPPPLHTNR